MKSTIATLSLALVLTVGALAGTAPVTNNTKATAQTPTTQPAAKTVRKKKARKAHKAAKETAPVKK